MIALVVHEEKKAKEKQLYFFLMWICNHEYSGHYCSYVTPCLVWTYTNFVKMALCVLVAQQNYMSIY